MHYAYRGPNMFLAGLNYARINRGRYPLDPGGHVMGVQDQASDHSKNWKTREEWARLKEGAA